MKNIILIACATMAIALVGCGTDANSGQAQAMYKQDADPILAAPAPTKEATTNSAPPANVGKVAPTKTK